MERQDHIKTYCICEQCAKECQLGHRVDGIIRDHNSAYVCAYCGEVANDNRYGLINVRPISGGKER